MSRLARKPLEIPTGVEFKLQGNQVLVKGKKGQLEYQLHEAVNVNLEGNKATIGMAKPAKSVHPMVGTTLALLTNMVKGVHEGFEIRLQLVGVGYRAKLQGTTLELSLGFSHPVNFMGRPGITIECPSNTEIVLKGIDKQKLGQFAAEIMRKRSPDSYKGKGIRVFGAVIPLKETKKK